MGVKTESDTGQHQRLEDVKKLASRITLRTSGFG